MAQLLEVDPKEFLPPRMNKDQRDAMTAAVAGLQIWCTDCGPTAAMYFLQWKWWSTGTGITKNRQLQLQITLKVGITRAGSYC
jgi:hypothetical protein